MKYLLLIFLLVLSGVTYASNSVSISYGSVANFGTVSFGSSGGYRVETVSLGFFEGGTDSFTSLDTTFVTEGPLGVPLAIGLYDSNDFSYFGESLLLQLISKSGDMIGYVSSSSWPTITSSEASASPVHINMTLSVTDHSLLSFYGHAILSPAPNGLGGLDVVFLPEPSSYALIIGGLSLGILFLKRK